MIQQEELLKHYPPYKGNMFLYHRSRHPIGWVGRNSTTRVWSPDFSPMLSFSFPLLGCPGSSRVHNPTSTLAQLAFQLAVWSSGFVFQDGFPFTLFYFCFRAVVEMDSTGIPKDYPPYKGNLYYGSGDNPLLPVSYSTSRYPLSNKHGSGQGASPKRQSSSNRLSASMIGGLPFGLPSNSLRNGYNQTRTHPNQYTGVSWQMAPCHVL